MILLDTNVISALMRPAPEGPVLQWLDNQPRSSIWITSITVMELRYGLQIMPKGMRRDRMFQSLETLLLEKIEERIAPDKVGVFISYNHADLTIANALRQSLIALSSDLDPFIDHVGLQAGDEYEQKFGTVYKRGTMVSDDM